MADRPSWITRAFRWLRIPLLLWGVLALFACTLADRLIFFPPPAGYTPRAKALVAFETTRGESIRAFHFPADPGRPTLLYSHGNAEDLAGSLPLYREWHDRGWGVLAYDYPGYGLSGGRPTEASCERAIEAAWDHLTGTGGIAPSDIVIVGRSVGGGPSVWLAERVDAAGLVLISPFTSAFSVHSPAQHLLPGDRFPNLRRIRGVECPLLVVHGEADGIIPPSHGRRLVEASPASAKRFHGIAGAGHNDLFRVGGPEILREIEAFVGSLPR